MVRQTARIIVLEILGAFALLVLIGFALVVVRLASGPIELTQLRDDVERAMARARDNQPVALERLWLSWSPQERRVLVTANGVALYTHAGEVVANARSAAIDLDVSALLLGEVRLDSLELQDGHMLVERVFDTVWSVAGSPVSIDIPMAETFEVETLVARANAFSDSLFEALSEDDGPSVKRVSVTDFSVTVRNVHGRALAEIPRLEARYEVSPGGKVAASLRAGSPGKGLPGDVVVTLDLPDERDSLAFELALQDWSVGDLLARVVGTEAAGVPGSEGLPLSGRVSLSASRGTGVTALGFGMNVGAGRIAAGGQELNLTSARVNASFDVAVGTLSLAVDEMVSERLSGSFALTLPEALSIRDSAPFAFALTSPGFTLDARPVADRPWVLADVSAQGSLDLLAGVLRLDTLGAGLTSARATGEATLRWRGEGFPVAEGPPVALLADFAIAGNVTKDEVFAFWPVSLGAEVRSQVAADYLAGTVSDVALKLNIQPGSVVDGIMADEAVDLRYRVTGGAYRFLPDLPPVMNASGTGHLRGNSLSLRFDSGRIEDWDVGATSLDISAFKPEGSGQLSVEGQGSGPLVSGLRMLQNSRLQLGRAEGLDVTRISGMGSGRFTFQRPVGADVPLEAVRYAVKGEAVGAGFTDVAAAFDLSGVRATADIDPTRVLISGTGQLADTPVRFDVLHQLGEGVVAPTRIEASAVVTPATLNALGLLMRAYVTGAIPATMTATGRLPDLSRMVFSFDLGDARIDVPEIGLLKALGAPATGKLRYEAATSVRPAFYTASFASDGTKLEGDVRLTRDNRVDVISLKRAFIPSRMDVSGEIARDALDGLRISLVGDYLDASGYLGGGGLSAGGDESSTLTGNFVLQADVGRLTLREGLDVRDAALSARVRGGSLESLKAMGVTAPGRRFEADLESGRDQPRRFRVKADDAGFLLQAAFGLDTVTGGRLETEGVLGRAGAATEFTLNLFDARVRDVPFITQVLSLASLRGLADTLAGEGVMFTRVEIPVRNEGSRFTILGGRASGPALGLTFSGSIETGPARTLALSGVLVPSFGVNSALGGIPIIGDLFVSRQGEGVFSVRYDISGTLDKAQVTANLLSAITPGVLRRIFENPNDPEIDRLRSLEDEATARPQGTGGGGGPPPPPPETPAIIDPSR